MVGLSSRYVQEVVPGCWGIHGGTGGRVRSSSARSSTHRTPASMLPAYPTVRLARQVLPLPRQGIFTVGRPGVHGCIDEQEYARRAMPRERNIFCLGHDHELASTKERSR